MLDFFITMPKSRAQPLRSQNWCQSLYGMRSHGPRTTGSPFLIVPVAMMPQPMLSSMKPRAYGVSIEGCETDGKECAQSALVAWVRMRLTIQTLKRPFTYDVHFFGFAIATCLFFAVSFWNRNFFLPSLFGIGTVPFRGGGGRTFLVLYLF